MELEQAKREATEQARCDQELSAWMVPSDAATFAAAYESALAERGFVIAPKEATEAMVEEAYRAASDSDRWMICDGDDFRRAYRAAIRKSQEQG